MKKVQAFCGGEIAFHMRASLPVLYFISVYLAKFIPAFLALLLPLLLLLHPGWSLFIRNPNKFLMTIRFFSLSGTQLFK